MSTRTSVFRFLAMGAVATGAVVPVLAGPASAQGECPAASPSDVTCQPTNPVTPDGASAAAGVAAQVQAEQASRPVSGGLPVTGGDVAGLAALGVTALASGGLLVRTSRARRAER